MAGESVCVLYPSKGSTRGGVFLREPAPKCVPSPSANPSHHGDVAADVGDACAVNDNDSFGNSVEDGGVGGGVCVDEGQRRGENDLCVVDGGQETRRRQVTVIVVDGK